MKDTLQDLNAHLFAALERLNDESLGDEALEKEIQRSRAIGDVGKTIIEGAKVQLEAYKHLDEIGGRTTDHSLPRLLIGQKAGS